MMRIRRKVLTAMHDGISTFFIITTSDLIGQVSKTTKKLRFKVHFAWFFFFFETQSHHMQFSKKIVFAELHQRSKIISYCLLLFWLVKHKHFLKFISRKWIFFVFILKFNYELPAVPAFLKSKIFYVSKSQCRGTMKFTVVLMWSIT